MTQSFKTRLSQFKIAIESTLPPGKETTSSRRVDKFCNQTKLLALLCATDSEGIELLQTGI